MHGFARACAWARSGQWSIWSLAGPWLWHFASIFKRPCLCRLNVLCSVRSGWIPVKRFLVSSWIMLEVKWEEPYWKTRRRTESVQLTPSVLPPMSLSWTASSSRILLHSPALWHSKIVPDKSQLLLIYVQGFWWNASVDVFMFSIRFPLEQAP